MTVKGMPASSSLMAASRPDIPQPMTTTGKSCLAASAMVSPQPRSRASCPSSSSSSSIMGTYSSGTSCATRKLIIFWMVTASGGGGGLLPPSR